MPVKMILWRKWHKKAGGLPGKISERILLIIEEEAAKLKNRALWQQILADIKPKRKGNCYGSRNKWKKFGKKVLDEVFAVGYAETVC